jgi:hypothetical protein
MQNGFFFLFLQNIGFKKFQKVPQLKTLKKSQNKLKKL